MTQLSKTGPNCSQRESAPILKSYATKYGLVIRSIRTAHFRRVGALFGYPGDKNQLNGVVSILNGLGKNDIICTTVALWAT